MAWSTTKGWNFRDNIADYTDPANTTYVYNDGANPGGEDYPTTRSIGGDDVTFGWNSVAVSVITRVGPGAVDVRLGGVHAEQAGGDAEFRVDLPAAGAYNVRLAMGDPGIGATDQTMKIEIRDGIGGSVLLSIDDTDYDPAGDGPWIDAAGTEHTTAQNWVDNNAQVEVTFSGTVCALALIQNGSYNQSRVAHLELEQVASATGAPTRLGFASARRRLRHSRR